MFHTIPGVLDVYDPTQERNISKQRKPVRRTQYSPGKVVPPGRARLPDEVILICTQFM